MNRQKHKAYVRQIRPIDFDFDTNKGKTITVKTSDSVMNGAFIGLVDNIITLVAASKSSFPVISQIDYSEIQTIIL